MGLRIIIPKVITMTKSERQQLQRIIGSVVDLILISNSSLTSLVFSKVPTTLEELLELLQVLRVNVSYNLLDLEATRREKQFLTKNSEDPEEH